MQSNLLKLSQNIAYSLFKLDKNVFFGKSSCYIYSILNQLNESGQVCWSPSEGRKERLSVELTAVLREWWCIYLYTYIQTRNSADSSRSNRIILSVYSNINE